MAVRSETPSQYRQRSLTKCSFDICSSLRLSEYIKLQTLAKTISNNGIDKDEST